MLKILKMLVVGVSLGVGLMAGVADAGVIGWHVLGARMAEGDARAIAGLERANAAIQWEFPASAPADNLEDYRACLHANDAGNSAATVDACRDSFRDWQDSPTFALELEKLQRIDIRAAQIMTEYDNSHPNQYFD